MDTQASKPVEIAQTLDRGLQVLEVLAGAQDGLSPTDVAAELGVHRSIVARLLATLLNRGYVGRRRDGRYVLGTALLSLARQVSNNLLVVAGPVLADASERLGLTVVLHVADADDAVALASVEPRNAAFHVGIRPGSRHPLPQAASGQAILAGRPAVAGEDPEITAAREHGFARTTSKLVPNFTGIAAPITIAGTAEASVGLIVPVQHTHDEDALAREVVTLADRIGRALY
ncbi:helix-turn-helix domain-containing protein [Actinokineospora sp. NBRC 105648]|uniref:IclR family transcriptional regulator n=1 Tax=Actinokineospora sp. NBRC 105648 TaxID=3032206 RepID=UPI0024A4893E|nr:helix-turn-helix domain-containing protein [Actinokineospora sp. NBRC 105648]GLZ43762.1 transcriptional regulator [Actinokineospora sp. NBRC 105648]